MELDSRSRDWIYSFIIWSAFLGQAVSYSKIYFYHFILLFGVFVYISTADRRDFFSHLSLKKDWFFFFLLFWSVLSLSFVDQKVPGLIGLGQILCGLGIMFFWKLIINKKRLVKGLGFLFAAHVLLGLLEAFTPLRWPISPVSPYAAFFGKVSSILPPTYEDYPTGFFWHPNNASFVILIASPFILHSRYFTKVQKFIYAFVVFIFMIKAGAKAQFILFALYSIYLVLRNFRATLHSPEKVLLLAGGFLISITILIKSLNSDQSTELLKSLDVARSYSLTTVKILRNEELGEVDDFIQERFRFIVGAINEFKKSPLTGIGIGQNTNLTVEVNNVPTLLKGIHHYWIELLMVGGLLLSLPYFFFLIQLSYKNFKRKRIARIEVLLLYCIGVISISSAIYFLPQWILYSIANDEELEEV